jgi:hypothetical protein
LIALIFDEEYELFTERNREYKEERIRNEKEEKGEQ